MARKAGLLVALAVMVAGGAQAAELRLASPDGKLAFSLSDNTGPTYALSYVGEPILRSSALGLYPSQGAPLGPELSIAASAQATVDQPYETLVGKRRGGRDRYNQLTVDLAEPGPDGRKLQLVVRAYDDGLAFRYRLPANQQSLQLRPSELTRFNFAADYDCWGLNLGRYDTAHEGEFDPVKASHLRDHNRYDAPFVCRTGKAAFALAEADLKDWAGMYLSGRGEGGLGAAVQLSPRLDDPGVAVKLRVGSEAVSPWRVVMLGSSAGKLIDSDLIARLNPPSAVADTSWIKPGKSAWDWWNGPAVSGVEKAGTNTATIKRFIDFAAQAGLPYMLIDEGWYAGGGGDWKMLPGADVTRAAPDVDMAAITAYAAERGVGLWVWLHWQALDAQMDEALAQYQAWGLRGVKVDYMNRDDQQMVEFYHRLLKKTAEHRLMVDLHGASHPTGLTRTYPHYLTQEGVLGAEYNKWSRRVTATHNVTLAYTRGLVGPMDYTPGGFRNRTPATFEPRFTLPFVQTTRAQGLAMYVVYDSPFACVSDSPDAYVENGRPAAGFDFIQAVPTSWDETRFIAGDIGDYVVVARRQGQDWYVGAMTSESGRTVKVPLGFLPAGRFKARLWQDGAAPDALAISERVVTSGAALTLKLAPSGGAVIRLTPEV
jgi:alpha-glucosidase